MKPHPSAAAAAIIDSIREGKSLMADHLEGLALHELEDIHAAAIAEQRDAYRAAEDVERHFSLEEWVKEKQREKHRIYHHASEAHASALTIAETLIKRKFKLGNAKVQRKSGGRIKLSVEADAGILDLLERSGYYDDMSKAEVDDLFLWCFVSSVSGYALPSTY